MTISKGAPVTRHEESGSVREYMREAFARFPDRIALVTSRGAWTFAQLADTSVRLATLFEDLAVGSGDIVGSVLSPLPEDLYEMTLATKEHGAALFAIAPNTPPEVLAKYLRSVAPKIIVYDAELLPRFPVLVESVLPNTRMLASRGPRGRYEGLLERVKPRQKRGPISPDSLAAIGYTSGTTGPPKGITVTHGAMAASVRMLLQIPGLLGSTGGGFLNAIPLFAAGGSMIVPVLYAGVTMFVPDHFDAVQALKLIQERRIAFGFVTPSMLIDLLDVPDLERYDLTSLRAVVYGSSIMPAPKLEEAIRRIGPVFLQGYGMSECLPPVAWLTQATHGTKEHPADYEVLSSVGTPFEGVKVVVESPSHAPLAAGQIGEVVIQSPTASTGYWQDPERSAAATAHGWWHSGDVGYFDSSGRLHIMDRMQDLMQCQGRTIYPRPIEEALSAHPAAKEVCVVQAPGSERIVAAVSLRRPFHGRLSDATLPGELLAFLQAHLEPATIPDEIRVFAELPRSIQGKVLKREIRDAVAGQG